MTSVKKHFPSYIEDKNRRLNVKSKRRRNLIKKVIELKRLCGQDIFLVIGDKEFDKLYVYNSSPGIFTSSYVDSIQKQSDSS